jgi:hypothetical protein
MRLVCHIFAGNGGTRWRRAIPDGKQGQRAPNKLYRLACIIIGLPTVCGRLAIAAAQTMQRAASIGPGLRDDERATLPLCFIKTARSQC